MVDHVKTFFALSLVTNTKFGCYRSKTWRTKKDRKLTLDTTERNLLR